MFFFFEVQNILTLSGFPPPPQKGENGHDPKSISVIFIL